VKARQRGISLQPQHGSTSLFDHLGELVRRGEKRLWRRKRFAPSINARDMGTTGFEAYMAPNELCATCDLLPISI
jgi:hypothetical protein